MTTCLPLLELTRDRLVESTHTGAIAVADAAGQLVAAYGDPQAVFFMRSSAKPFQALPLVESGAARAWGVSEQELALICASHLGLDKHAATAAALQKRIGVTEADLLCGTPPAEDTATGQAPTPNRHNCSGKHTGMLALARHLALPLADYVNPTHPIQQMILKAFAETCGLAAEAVTVGIDGCSAPNFAVPLVHAATAFARLADPAALPRPRAAALRTIFDAMTHQPEMVRGPGRWDTEMMRLRPGLIVSKSGAEGYLGLALRAGACGPASPAVGVALKIADGANRALVPTAVEILQQLQALDDTQRAALARQGFSARQPIRNGRGLETGEMRTVFALQFA